MKALIVSGDGFEDLELLFPYYRLLEEGIATDIASLAKGRITGKHGYAVEALFTLSGITADSYGILLLPGGKAPTVLRRDAQLLALVRRFFAAGKIVAAICHGPQILVSAGVLQGRAATCYHRVAGELEDAGCFYQDREVVVDANLVTARVPADLPAFMREIMRLVRAAS